MTGKKGSEVFFFSNLDRASRAIAKYLIQMILEATVRKKQFNLAVAGGDTPRHLYSLLASKFSDQIPWNLVHIFWSDERYVPKESRYNNYAMVLGALISKIPIPNPNIHRIITELEPPEKAASSYEKLLRKYFSDKAAYTFDLLLLGMGEDGHIASLFPHSAELMEKERWVVSVNAPSAIYPRKRITLTLPIINKAKSIFFLVSGTKKKDIVNSIQKDHKIARKIYPAAMVSSINKLIWFVVNDLPLIANIEKPQ